MCNFWTYVSFSMYIHSTTSQYMLFYMSKYTRLNILCVSKYTVYTHHIYIYIILYKYELYKLHYNFIIQIILLIYLIARECMWESGNFKISRLQSDWNVAYPWLACVTPSSSAKECKSAVDFLSKICPQPQDKNTNPELLSAVWLWNEWVMSVHMCTDPNNEHLWEMQLLFCVTGAPDSIWTNGIKSLTGSCFQTCYNGEWLQDMPCEQSADVEFHSFWKCIHYQYGIIYSLAVRFRLSGVFCFLLQ